jgi:TRAP-type C4-dicarboxylate transport system permease small subunit
MAETLKLKPHHHVPPGWPVPIRGLAALSRALAVVEGVGIGACLLAVVGLATWQFVERNLTMRHIPFFRVPGWTDGVIRHSVFLLGFLGGAYATYTGRHIRIDAVTRAIPPRRRMALRVVTTLAALFIVGLFVKSAWGFYGVTLEESGEASQAGQLFTPARGAMIIVLGYAVVAFHFLVQVVLDLCWLISGQDPPSEWVAEASHADLTPVGEAGSAPGHSVIPPTADGAGEEAPGDPQ